MYIVQFFSFFVFLYTKNEKKRKTTKDVTTCVYNIDAEMIKMCSFEIELPAQYYKCDVIVNRIEYRKLSLFVGERKTHIDCRMCVSHFFLSSSISTNKKWRKMFNDDMQTLKWVQKFSHKTHVSIIQLFSLIVSMKMIDSLVHFDNSFQLLINTEKRFAIVRVIVIINVAIYFHVRYFFSIVQSIKWLTIDIRKKAIEEIETWKKKKIEENFICILWFVYISLL